MPTLSKYSQIIMAAFAISLLISVYLLFTLPSDLKFKGNVQYMDLVTPVLVTLYISLGITAILACTALYAEMKNTKVAIVYKEKSEAQVAEEKSKTGIIEILSLSTKSITSTDPSTIISDSLTLLGSKVSAVAGACYIIKEENNIKFAKLLSGYALPISETGTDTVRFNVGEGMVGQAAKSGSEMFIDEIPEGYIQAASGLGQASPKFIAILPIKKGEETKAILEIATFKALTPAEKLMANKFVGEIGGKL